MKLKKAAISIFISQEGTRIELYDWTSGQFFAEIKLTPEQLSMALSRLSHTPCEIEIWNQDKINKQHEHKPMEFEMPRTEWKTKKEEAGKIAKEVCPEGWVPDCYFGSQGSFFEKDGKSYARCTIRRWVTDEEEVNHGRI